MVYEGDFVAGIAKDHFGKKIGEDAKFFPFPAVGGGQAPVVSGGDAAVVLKDGKNQKAAMEFLEYLATPEALRGLGRGRRLPLPEQEASTSPPTATTSPAQTAKSLVDAGDSVRFDMSDQAPAAFGGTKGAGEWKLLQDFLRDPSDPQGHRGRGWKQRPPRRTRADRRDRTLLKEASPPPVAPADRDRRRRARRRAPRHRPRVRPPRPAPARRARRLPRAVLRGPQLLRRRPATASWAVDNYTEMFRDPATLKAIRNTAIWVVVAPTLLTGLGLVLAVLVEKVRWATAFKLLLFMPMAVSFLAAGIIFRLAYDEDPEKGVLNAAAVSVHDAFEERPPYPTARARDGQGLTKAADGSYRTTATASPGDTVGLGLVGVRAEDLPGERAAARTRRRRGRRRPTNCAVSSTWTSRAAAEGSRARSTGRERTARR